MAWLGGERGYDRARTLARAQRAVRRGAHARAIALYERVHAIEPENMDLLRRMAVERMRSGQRDRAWADCQVVVADLARRGFVAQAIGLCREFATHFPTEAAVWHTLAELELERDRTPDAAEVLVAGARGFRFRGGADDRLSLLRRARELDATHFEAGFELAGLALKSGAGHVARRILEGLLPHVSTRRQRRKLRGRLFRLDPTPAAAWRWLVA